MKRKTPGRLIVSGTIRKKSDVKTPNKVRSHRKVLFYLLFFIQQLPSLVLFYYASHQIPHKISAPTKSSFPFVMGTITSLPITWRLRWASALSSPVSLCRYWSNILRNARVVLVLNVRYSVLEFTFELIWKKFIFVRLIILVSHQPVIKTERALKLCM
jgi:hypothetical protein